jgi:hypothetical protein
MSFLADNEHIILMDIPKVPYALSQGQHALRVDELKQLRQVGVGTALEYVWWDRIVADQSWDHVDEMVNRCREAGLKVLLSTYQVAPQGLNSKWYLRQKDGGQFNHLSLWNEEAQAYEHGFLKEICRRYNSEDVLCINSLQCDGETVLPLDPAFYDEAAVESYRAFTNSNRLPVLMERETQDWLRRSLIETLIDQQRIFLDNSKFYEVWFQLHPQITHLGTGNQFIRDIYQAFREALPLVEIYSIQYTYFPHGKFYWDKIAYDRVTYDVRFIGGAEHCAGLLPNTPIGISHGLRGLILGPTHPFTGYERLQPWMVDLVQEANQQWQSGSFINPQRQ